MEREGNRIDCGIRGVGQGSAVSRSAGGCGWGTGCAGAGMTMISVGDGAGSARTGAGGRGGPSGHGGVSGAPTQPESLLVGAFAGVELRVLGPLEAVVGGRWLNWGRPSSVPCSRCW
jgi:hypothetical protein